MPDFGKYSNYSEQTAFSSVVFGAQAPVLEVELNELQEIFNHKLKLLSALVGDNLIVPASGSVSYDIDSLTLTITNCVAVSGSFITFIPSAQVVMSSENDVAYLRLTEKTVKSDDTLTAYGAVGADPVENTIIDPRVGVETSRRKVITFALECAATMPQNVPGSNVAFVKVGELAAIETDEEGNEVAPGTLGFSLTNIINNLTETLNNIESKVTNLEQNPVDTGMQVQTSYAAGKLSLTFTQNDGTGSSASIPLATKTTPGLMMVGEGLDVDDSGRVSTSVEAQTEAVTASVMEQLSSNTATVEDVNEAFEALGVEVPEEDEDTAE